MFLSTGKIRYSPQLVGDKVGNNFWIVIDCDPEIGRYYRRLAEWRGISMQKPAWREHITINYNESPLLYDSWGIHEGKKIEFTYKPEVNIIYDLFYYLPVECEAVWLLRKELGLKKRWQLHLTIGNTK